MIIAGFGFRHLATETSLRSAYEKAGPADALATLVDKADHPALRAFARGLNLPVIEVNPDMLEEVQTATHSDKSLKHRSIPSVSEAAALAAAGPNAQLLTSRQVSDDRFATCALAQSPSQGTSK